MAAVNPTDTVPVAEAPAMPGAPVVPSFDVVRVEPTGETVIAGQAEPDAKVELLDGTTTIATAEANERGEWAMALDKPLPPGPHDLAVRTTTKDQTVATLSDQRVTVSVPEPGSKDVLVVMNAPDAASRILQVPDGTPPAPVVAGTPSEQAAAAPPAAVDAGTPGEQVATAAPTAPAEAPIAAEPPVAGEPHCVAAAPVAGEAPVKSEPPIATEPQVTAKAEPAKPEVTVAAVEADTAGSVYIAGTVKTGETVRVYLDDKPLGEAQPSPSGTWLVETKKELPPGKYTVRADQVDSSGTGHRALRGAVRARGRGGDPEAQRHGRRRYRRDALRRHAGNGDGDHQTRRQPLADRARRMGQGRSLVDHLPGEHRADPQSALDLSRAGLRDAEGQRDLDGLSVDAPRSFLNSSSLGLSPLGVPPAEPA